MRAVESVRARRMRRSSLRQFVARSHAIIFIQPTESAADHGSGEARVSQNSGGSTGPRARNALTPAA